MPINQKPALATIPAMRKIIINKKYRGSIEVPQTQYAPHIFGAVKRAVGEGTVVGVHLFYSQKKLKALANYQRGGAQDTLDELDFYIRLGTILDFNTDDASGLKNTIEMTNDVAHNHFNITKRLQLLGKKTRLQTGAVYLFWDIENFSNIGSLFTEVIEKFAIEDDHIYLAANPDSLYLKKDEWEAELYDYGKRLTSFNFTKCDHGKNVADDILLEQFESLKLKKCDVYLMSYDRELKERFGAASHPSNNFYILGK